MAVTRRWLEPAWGAVAVGVALVLVAAGLLFIGACQAAETARTAPNPDEAGAAVNIAHASSSVLVLVPGWLVAVTGLRPFGSLWTGALAAICLLPFGVLAFFVFMNLALDALPDC